MNYFFCIGGQKTGTTILANLLDMQNNIACIWESYALRPLHSTSVLNPDSENCKNHGFDRDFICSLRNEWKLDSVDYYVNPQHREESFKKTMPKILDDFASRNKATVVGDKWPWYIRHMETLMRTFPDAKFIHTVRDPRGLWNSAQRFLARERGDVVLWEVLEFERILEKYNLGLNRLMTLRYEDLILFPKKTISRICNFLGVNLAEDDVILNLIRDDKRWSWVPEAVKPIMVDNVNKWMTQITRHDIQKIESFSGWFMKKYSYTSTLSG